MWEQERWPTFFNSSLTKSESFSPSPPYLATQSGLSPPSGLSLGFSPNSTRKTLPPKVQGPTETFTSL